MKSAVHLFDGYLSTNSGVRARCSCGFLTTGQAAQRPARQQLATSHGLSDLRCEACGRGTEPRSEVGLPLALTVQADPVTGRDRLVCAEGSGGCDLTSQIGARATAQVAETTDVNVPGLRAEIAAHQGTVVATAVGVLMGKGGVGQARARIRLARQAAHHGISEVEAANRIVARAAASRRLTRSTGSDSRPESIG